MTVMIDGIEYLSLTAVAEQLTTTETRVLMMLKEKVLLGGLIEGDWFVSSASLACYDRLAPYPVKLPACASNCSSGCACG